MTLHWKDSYKIGDVEIDAQHHELVNRIGRFLAATDKATEAECALRLYEHTHEHFDYEEEVMRRLQYPAMRAHISQHDVLKSTLDFVTDNIASGTLNKKPLESFLIDWTLNHIATYDARLVAYMRSCELRM